MGALEGCNPLCLTVEVMKVMMRNVSGLASVILGQAMVMHGFKGLSNRRLIMAGYHQLRATLCNLTKDVSHATAISSISRQTS